MHYLLWDYNPAGNATTGHSDLTFLSRTNLLDNFKVAKLCYSAKLVMYQFELF